MNRILLGATALMLGVPAMAQMQAPVAPQAAPPIAPQIAQRMEMTQTRDQAVAKVREHFTMMDTNRDGFVAGDEMQSMRGHHQGQRQIGERRGRGGDRMTRNERALRDPAAAFDRLDANRDGMISREEFGRAREVREERRIVINRAPVGVPGVPGMTGDHQRMRKMHRMGGMGGGGMMRLADLDRDGRVSLQEATTSALQRFDRIDTNRDGRITTDERMKQREIRKQMRGNRAG